MYFHATQIGNLEVLKPNISNNGNNLLYFSSKRENVVVYISNAVEKYCLDNNIQPQGCLRKWASYGFNNDKLVLEEYYPNATVETYKGVSGYIYYCDEKDADTVKWGNIPYVYVSKKDVKIFKCEKIDDAYEELLKLEKQGLILIKRYEENSEKKMDWIKRTINEEYEKNREDKVYVAFLRAKFPFLK